MIFVVYLKINKNHSNFDAKNKTINETPIRKPVPTEMCQKSLILFYSLIREFGNIEKNKMKNYHGCEDW